LQFGHGEHLQVTALLAVRGDQTGGASMLPDPIAISRPASSERASMQSGS
jgi:hypothetical protein